MGWKNSTKKGFWIGFILGVIFAVLYIADNIYNFLYYSGVANPIAQFPLSRTLLTMLSIFLPALLIALFIIGISSLIGSIIIWKARSWHIFHLVILVIIFVNSLGLTIQILPIILSILFANSLGLTMFILPIILTIFLLIEIIFMALSFNKCKIDNTYFKKSGIISMLGLISAFIAAFISLAAFAKNADIETGGIGLAIIAFIIGLFSFLIFEIISLIFFFKGYSKFKIPSNKQA